MKSRHATTQLAFLLERYYATGIATALVTGNYTAAAAIPPLLEIMDFSKAIRGKKTLAKALDKYQEAMSSAQPVKPMLPGVIPEWMKPSHTSLAPTN